MIVHFFRDTLIPSNWMILLSYTNNTKTNLNLIPMKFQIFLVRIEMKFQLNSSDIEKKYLFKFVLGGWKHNWKERRHC